MLIPTNNGVIASNKDDSEKNPQANQQNTPNNNTGSKTQVSNRVLNKAFLRSIAETEFLKSLFGVPNEFNSGLYDSYFHFFANPAAS
jgi:hypothetical protein